MFNIVAEPGPRCPAEWCRTLEYLSDIRQLISDQSTLDIVGQKSGELIHIMEIGQCDDNFLFLDRNHTFDNDFINQHRIIDVIARNLDDKILRLTGTIKTFAFGKIGDEIDGPS